MTYDSSTCAGELFFSSDRNAGGTNFNNSASTGAQNFRFEFETEAAREPSRALLLLGGIIGSGASALARDPTLTADGGTSKV